MIWQDGGLENAGKAFKGFALSFLEYLQIMNTFGGQLVIYDL